MTAASARAAIADLALPSALAKAPNSGRRGHLGEPGAALAAATAAAFVFAAPGAQHALIWAPVTFAIYVTADIASLASRAGRWTGLLPLTRAVLRLVQPIAGASILLASGSVRALAAPSPFVAVAGAGAGMLAATLGRRAAHRAGREVRVAVVGPDEAVRQLRGELDSAGDDRYRVLGSIGPADGPPTTDRLGSLASLGALVDEHAIDLIVIASSASRLDVFERIVDSCLDLPIGICELAQFYEDALGRVPEAEIDAAWFRYIMHPRFQSPDTASKRALDLGVGLVATAIFLPVLLISAAMIKLQDGGPVFFCQQRIGSGGRPFTLFKLRTMRVAPASVEWSSANDPRVTPIGRLLRRTHIDELPQLLNVLRGEMSVVGPRPEQPELVAHLERDLRFYSRRHLVKPGITGWAQVRCGYCGSDAGSARKLCHDLFYLKHRCLSLDLAILLETVRTLVADRQYPGAPAVSPAREWRQPPLHVLQEFALDDAGIDSLAAEYRAAEHAHECLAGVETS